MKAEVTEEGLLIPREIAEHPGFEEVEILEEPGRLLIVAGGTASQERAKASSQEDPLRGLGRNPIHTGARDGSVDHDRYLYGA